MTPSSDNGAGSAFIARRLVLARLALVWEDLVIRSWRAASLVILFLGLVLLGVVSSLPGMLVEYVVRRGPAHGTGLESTAFPSHGVHRRGRPAYRSPPDSRFTACAPARRRVAPAAVFVDDPPHLGGGLVQVGVHDHHRAQALGGLPLAGSVGQPGPHVVLAVAPAAQAVRLIGIGRRLEEQQQRLRMAGAHLACPLDVDLEEDVAPRRRIGVRRAVAVLAEIGPLEEITGGDRRIEDGAVNEAVGVVGLAGALRPGRPRAAEPEPVVPADEQARQSALAGPARSGENDQ